MSEVQKLLAEVVAKHSGPYRTQEHPFDGKRLYTCNYGCDWHGPNTTAFAEHVAAEIDKALGGLRLEYCARHHSGGGALGFKTESDALQHIADNPPVPGGVERPPDPGYSGVESRWVSGWTEVTE